MGRTHAPSEARAIINAWKGGRNARQLAEEADRIDDPYHAAWALFQLAADEPKLLRRAYEGFDQVEPDWRKAELAAELAPRITPETVTELTQRVLDLPAGPARSDALNPLTKRVPREDRLPLLKAALTGTTPVEDAKTILRAWAREPVGDLDNVLQRVDPDTRARLYGYLHLQDEKSDRPLVLDSFKNALRSAEDAPERSQVLRYLATVARTRDELDALLEREQDGEPRLRLLLKTIAQADRMGETDQAERYVEQAQAVLPKIQDPVRRQRLETNLQKAESRLHGKSVPKKEKTPDPRNRRTPRVGLPQASGPRNVLALHNGYTGNLGPPHLRAIGRAAPLCAAFGLDLLLIGFPSHDAHGLVDQAERDTRIGEGADHLHNLLEAGRIHWTSREHHTRPEKWPVVGPVVATTPHPDPDKASSLDDLPKKAVLVVGLGPQGLPKALLDRAPHHLELTGHGISLETATAMGVIAHVLRRETLRE